METQIKGDDILKLKPFSLTKLFAILNCALCVMFFAGCTSLQTDVYIDEVNYSEDVVKFENRFALLDGAVLSDEIDDKKKLSSCSSLIADIEVTLADKTIKNASKARLFALEGLCYLMTGNESKAEVLYDNSVAAYKGDARSAILASRLGKDKKLQNKLNESSDPNLIKIEMAADYYRSRKYLESSALFDEAFLSLDGFYREGYQSVRDKAWKMRSAEADSSGLISYSKLTVGQMLELTAENSDLLFVITAGKSLSQNELYRKATAAGLLNCVTVPSDSKNSVKLGTTVNKYIAARFLWNVYNARKNTQASANKYSQKYTKAEIDSPVPDVAITNPDFDAVIGCVEKSIVNLADGKNFEGKTAVSGSDMLNYIKKIK